MIIIMIIIMIIMIKIITIYVYIYIHDMHLMGKFNILPICAQPDIFAMPCNTAAAQKCSSS